MHFLSPTAIERWGKVKFRRAHVPIVSHRDTVISGGGCQTQESLIDIGFYSTILEFDVPSYRTNAAQQRGQAEGLNRQIWLTRDSLTTEWRSLSVAAGTDFYGQCLRLFTWIWIGA